MLSQNIWRSVLIRCFFLVAILFSQVATNMVIEVTAKDTPSQKAMVDASVEKAAGFLRGAQAPGRKL